MDGVIFDFNGTMFFYDAFQTQSWEQFILQKTGRTITPEEFVDYVHGRNMKETLQYFLGRDVKREEAAQLEEEKEVLYRALCLGSPAFRLADGLPEFLDLLAERNIPCTIATASGWNNVCFFFEHLGLERWFSLGKVAFNDGVVRGKPAPDLYRNAARKLGVPLAGCTVFEDAKAGIEAARRGPARQIIVVTSVQPRETLLAWGATDTIADYRDCAWLLRMLLPET